jgi:hypothetical protein
MAAKKKSKWGVVVGQKGKQRLLRRSYASFSKAGKEADLWSDATVVLLTTRRSKRTKSSRTR